ncbi:hypothetical protein [Rhodococcus sp. SGAir0479]|uniref:hypothetical protein n=1 Tax=Rhodococcus sp. SGAir0479 TaxID=2567884 RepID=UPI0010CD6326|nr:hypothetical protein [Rhodococcus sp. SGAir0479]QCQ92588.1 hypothetical protein E7742_16090 [Rhodococcus sp. SGAir0479]
MQAKKSETEESGQPVTVPPDSPTAPGLPKLERWITRRLRVAVPEKKGLPQVIAHRSAAAGRTSATWSLSTEELKSRLDQMFAGYPETRMADAELDAA